MKKTIVVADRDEGLQHAFMTVFSRDHFDIIYASTGKEVEKIADRIHPDVYIVNVNLPKTNGIEVYKKLQKQRLLETASFYFLKDANDRTELLGYQADGVREKPLNFFRVYETITKEDEIIELTDLIDERPDLIRRQTREPLEVGVETGAAFVEGKPDSTKETPIEAPAVPPSASESGMTNWDEEKELKAEEPSAKSPTQEEAGAEKGVDEHGGFEERLRDAMNGLTGSAVARTTENLSALTSQEQPQLELEAQFKTVLNQALGEAALKLSAAFAPVLTQYVEDYVKRMLLEIAEKVIREEIDKLLKESTG
jgi:CheY-like chemotaxis protein